VSVVQVPAYATLLAAGIAVVGSIVAVVVSGWLTRRAQQRQWTREAVVAQRRAELEACATFDAAVVLSVSHFNEIVRMPPAMRRRLLGRQWGGVLYAQSHALGADVVVPYSMVQMAASTPVQAAVEAVMTALGKMAAVADPQREAAYADARERVQDARKDLSRAVLTAGRD